MHVAHLCTLGAVFLLLTGCSPVYQKARSYFPPKHASKRFYRCVSHCSEALASNTVFCSQLQEQCTQLNNTALWQSQNNAFWYPYPWYSSPRVYPGPVYAGTGQTDCSFQMRQCTESVRQRYDACYVRCGGKVLVTQQCVENCDDS